MKIILTLFLTICYALGSVAQVINYTESQEDIQNPERGFYTPIYGVASSFTPLTASQLLSLKNNPNTPWQGNYTVRPTIIFRNYVLDIFKSTNLSSSFLNGVQADFNAAREAGVKLLLRFSYTYTAPTGSCGSWICPPYGDAPKSIVLAHIAQLKPYLQNNSDVILAVQNGFIGVWGEQYYTDYFGDASVQGRLTDQNWQDRIDVLAALLDAVPSNRMVQVRYPQMKQKFLHGVNAPVSSPAMNASQASNALNIARIGFHNDCFLAASDDQGTFWDYGTSSTYASNQTAILKPYSAQDSKWVVVGGETCSDTFSPQNDCAGQAVSDMDLLNYSYLNADYNNEVNNDWQTGGCMEEIKRRLGYRLVMRTSNFPSSIATGSNLTFSLAVANVGFAAPFNPKVLQLVLRNTSNNQVFKVNITGENADIRFWLSGETVTLNKTVALPTGIPAGTYDLLMHVSDNSNNNAIASRPEYSIQFANVGTWEPATGFNKLNRSITISNQSTTPAAPTNVVASAISTTEIGLSWNASQGATSYQVLRSSTSGGPYTSVATGITGNTYNNTGLTANTTYYYVVRAVNAVGASPNSAQASAKTLDSSNPPAVVATVYKHCNYGGTAVGLPVGDYPLSQLTARGVLDNDISSIKVTAGYEIIVYQNDNYGGTTHIFSADDACLVDNGINDWITSVKVRVKPIAYSNTIQAESYSSMLGVQLEATADAGGGQNVGWIDNNDWITYNSINIPTTGSYLIEYRVASINATGRLVADLNSGAVQFGTLNVPNTGGWQAWTTISQTVNINAGTYNFRIVAPTGGFNVNWFKISSAGNARISGLESNEEQVNIYPNPVTDKLFISADWIGSKVQIVSAEGVTKMKGKASEKGLNVSALPKGVYTLIIENKDKRLTKKFIKE